MTCGSSLTPLNVGSYAGRQATLWHPSDSSPRPNPNSGLRVSPCRTASGRSAPRRRPTAKRRRSWRIASRKQPGPRTPPGRRNGLSRTFKLGRRQALAFLHRHGLFRFVADPQEAGNRVGHLCLLPKQGPGIPEFSWRPGSTDIGRIDAREILAFRKAESERVSASTVNHALKFLRMVYEQAKRDGVLVDNHTADVSTIKKRDDLGRRPFTLPELARLLAVAEPEWKSLLLFGFYTGLRLGDLSRLTWPTWNWSIMSCGSPPPKPGGDRCFPWPHRCSVISKASRRVIRRARHCPPRHTAALHARAARPRCRGHFTTYRRKHYQE